MTSAQGSTPETIGDFSVLGEIGRGTFGPIYRARRGDLDAVVTVCRTDDDGLRRRFEHRARDAARLEHERLAWILEVGTTADGAPFTARESLPGRTLAEALKSGLELDVRSRLDLLRQVAEGLAFVHDRGLVHRDLKPAHLQLLPTGQVKILDLGIGSLASEQSQLTQRGVTLGSAAYMPPEQVRGGEVDARGDLFSWGVLAYELLTSQRPFRGKTLSALVYQILYKAPKPLQQAWNPAPRELGAIVDRCLQKEPDDRYPDAHRLLDDLGGLLRGIDQGSYPALVSGAAPALLEGTLPGDEDDPLSRSMISRTAAAVDQDPAAAGEEADRQDGLLGSTSPSPAVEVAALSAGAAETVISRPPSTRGNRSTQPVSVGGLDTVAPESVEDEVTRPLPVDEARARHAASQQAAAESVNPVAFETDSRALQELVAQGNLGAALDKLEERVQRQDVDPSIDPEIPTRRFDSDLIEQARQLDPAAIPPPPPGTAATVVAPQRGPAPSSPPVGPPTAGATQPMQPPAPRPSAPPPVASPPVASPPAARAPTTQPASAPPAARPPVPAPRQGPSLPFGMSPLVAAALGGGALLALLLLVALILSFGGEKEPEPVAEVEAPTPVVVPEPVVELPPPTRTGVEIDAAPWARIVQIRDAAGQVVGADLVTPAFVSLDAGAYEIELEAADGESVETCSVRVPEPGSASVDDIRLGPAAEAAGDAVPAVATDEPVPAAEGSEAAASSDAAPAEAGSVARCRVAFGEADALDYFRAAGWWR